MSTRNIFWGVSGPVPRADNLTTFMSQLSWHFFSSSVGWTDAICHQTHRYAPSLHRVDTKLTLEWGYHLLYNTFINYSPEPFRQVYYSQAAQNPMSNILTVLMAQTANVCFKLNTGSVVDCDWLDQVGCYGDRSETACLKWNLCSVNTPNTNNHGTYRPSLNYSAIWRLTPASWHKPVCKERLWNSAPPSSMSCISVNFFPNHILYVQ